MRILNNSDVKLAVFEHFEEHHKAHSERHSEFLDSAFRMIINHPFPGSQDKSWGSIESTTVKPFEIIKKLSKCSKYALPEFKIENDINLSDELMASLKPSRRQYNFMLKIIEKKRVLKRKYTG